MGFPGKEEIKPRRTCPVTFHVFFLNKGIIVHILRCSVFSVINRKLIYEPIYSCEGGDIFYKHLNSGYQLILHRVYW